MSNQADQVRSEVSKAYSEAVNKGMPCGCQDTSPARKGALVDLAGYSREELTALPAEAVENSFGCGNPVSVADLERGQVVLDLGSGAGIDLFLASQKVGPEGRVIGIDMTDAMIAKANANIRAGNYTNVEVRKGIIEDLPVANDSIDWVISNCVINLSPEKPKVFSEIARVLKLGGRMLVSDIVAQDLPEKIRENKALYSSCVAGAISEDKYLEGLRSAGLVDVEVRARLVYDSGQIVQSIMDGSSIGSFGEVSEADLRDLAHAVEGKVWSAKVYARKPAR